MRTIFTIALHELRGMLRNRAYVGILFVLPMLLILILGSALTEVFDTKDREPEPVRVAVWLQDRSQLQNGIELFLASPEVGRYLTSETAGSREEVEQEVREGRADFGLVVPEGFGEAVLKGNAAQWEYMYGRNAVRNETAHLLLDSFLRETNVSQAAALVLDRSAGLSQADSEAQAAATYAAEGTYVRIARLNADGSDYSALQYYSAAYLVMFLLYSGMMAAVSLIKEQEQQTLLRLSTIPIRPGSILIGKLAGQSLLSMLQAAVIIGGSRLLYGVEWGSRLGMLALVCLLTIAAAMSLALLLTLAFKSMKNVISAYQLVIIGMTALSGGFTPNVGEFLAGIGKWTLSHWASDGILRIMLNDAVQTVLLRLGVLAVIAAVLTIAAAVIYRKEGYASHA